MLLSNMFTMWYSIMHRVPNGWGIQTMNTCLLNLIFKNWNGMHLSSDSCRGCFWWYTDTLYGENKLDYLIGCLNFYLQAGNCFTSIAAKWIILPRNADSRRKNNSEPDAYHLAMYKKKRPLLLSYMVLSMPIHYPHANLITDYYYQSWPCLYTDHL